MKILLFTLSIILCVGGFGCEMHPSSQDTKKSEQSESNFLSEPEAVNPRPPSFFPTPKSS